MTKTMHEVYAEYWRSAAFQQVYRRERDRLYTGMVTIARELGAVTVVDIGCAYGQFVNLCNVAGIDAWGVDFPIDELMQFHAGLLASPGHFFYGAIDEPTVAQRIATHRHWDLVTCMDVVRHLSSLACVQSLHARYYLIKETCDNLRIRRKRRFEHDTRLWSPYDLAHCFEGYSVNRVYLPRFLAKFEHPRPWELRLLNQLSPTYVLLLEKTH